MSKDLETKDLIDVLELVECEDYCPLKPLPNNFDKEYWENFDDSNYKDPIRY